MKRNTPQAVWKYIAVAGEDDCWEWIGYRFKRGYGRFAIGRKMYAAHRIVYSLANPNSIEWSAGASDLVLHKCDNRYCCNPKHLFLGTQLDNMRDMKEKGRRADVSGESNPRAKLSAQVAADMCWIFSKGIARSEIARLFGVNWSSVDMVIKGRRYAGF